MVDGSEVGISAVAKQTSPRSLGHRVRRHVGPGLPGRPCRRFIRGASRRLAACLPLRGSITSRSSRALRQRRRMPDRDCFDQRIWLNVPTCRHARYHCSGREVERLNWLDAGESITTRIRAWVEAVAVDLGVAFDLEVPAHHPNAAAGYDLCHVVVPLRSGRGLPGEERSSNALHRAPAQRQVLERSRWLLRRNRDNPGNEQGVELRELLVATFVDKRQTSEVISQPMHERFCSEGR